MKKMKKFLLLLFTIIIISCNSSDKKYFKILEGEWQTVQFYQKEKNLSNNIYIITFHRKNHFLIRNTEIDNVVSSKYKIYKFADSFKMDIECSDINLSGNYNITIDTISQDIESFHILLTLDSENNYIQAIRHKLKYDFAPEHLLNNNIN
jgi:hypothetical protein